MAKKRGSKKPKMSMFQILVLVVIVAGFLLIAAGFYFGWFGNIITNITNITNKEVTELLNTQPVGTDCSLYINPSAIASGGSVLGQIRSDPNTFCEVFAYAEADGIWRKVWEGSTNADGLISESETIIETGIFHFRAVCDVNDNDVWDTDDCVTNEEIVVVEVADDGFDVGDSVGSGSGGGGNGNFGDDFETTITMPWTTGGPYLLGARITRSWDYVGEGAGPEQYPMEFSLFDSNGMAWQAIDYVPVNNVVVEVCPVTYHEDVSWLFVVSVGIQSEVTYSWNVQPYICSVLD